MVDVSPFEVCQVADAGDISVSPFSIDDAVREIEARADDLTSDGARLVTIGGDHTIALPLLRSAAKKHGPLAVVHFDAHLDTWQTYFDAPVTHGTPFRRAAEEGLIDMTGSLHVGIRGPLYGKGDLSDDAQLGFSIIAAHEVERHGLAAAIDRLHERIGDRPTYVSVDIDVLDPAHAPGTGTPEAGGLTSREMLEFIRAFREHHVVGADLVEVAPAYDHAQITGIAAAHVMYELITAMASTH
ncbi:agmatinase [Chryseoglobus frigidaquae]|uniref:Agmatinase n=1 Tax=Microcella frigidaquae TaxID=424758 RepID=A0A840X6T2_9MICO|nr:agmatinase [Microcella frigidaquae]